MHVLIVGTKSVNPFFQVMCWLMCVVSVGVKQDTALNAAVIHALNAGLLVGWRSEKFMLSREGN